ncbi:ComF family protein [Candidatus Sulfurimonas marisnigri]|uniref:ComF family protein n=1 Tax=Candidatus Sulfurimonas marisnigri TaxID=2740405 RepID=A0A7S7LZ84_9BACT|nr:phosphoribosyltransferase family protein [Candidatus Sulfurimonas marisnigri]QOY54173.1 ComF family protein [Candidatus Sulfurimonas marisnigri]
MRCMLCESLSFAHICSTCQTTFLTPSIYKRKILNNIEVISFYKYSEIKNLLHTKHTDLGFYIYSILAKNSLLKFASEFEFEYPVASVAIDDHVKSGYSHTAILNKSLSCKYIKPKVNKLRANNRVSYSGKSREFRLLNPRNFELKNFKEKNVILVDDIITTGFTLNQAVQAIELNNKEVLFCLTLVDVSFV